MAIELALAIAGALLFRRVRSTTLAAPAAWAAAAALALAAGDAWLAWRGRGVSSLAASLSRYLTAVGTFCPLMAVLGAKRPQDRGWQWVVASLWIVLLAPAGQALAAPSGLRLELFAAWKLMLAALVCMTLLNYLPTRFALAALLFAGGQAALLAPFLVNAADGQQWRLGGLVAIAASALAAAALYRQASHRAAPAASPPAFSLSDGPSPAARRRTAIANRRSPAPVTPAAAPSPLDSINQRWRSFRDAWGAFWGLRIMQRINQTAELSSWPVRLHWGNGFEPPSSSNDSRPAPEIDAAVVAHIEQTFDSLLRRFERPR
ncbi:MAG: hypothetical protein IT424_10380 [Pirellulales bacterium]|nr:hypothetical protein [Pirellulales bacterium]